MLAKLRPADGPGVVAETMDVDIWLEGLFSGLASDTWGASGKVPTTRKTRLSNRNRNRIDSTSASR
jgi:hypothetical protein